MRNLPVITGVLTIAMLGGIGYVLIAGGSPLWGGLALAFAALRLVLLLLQVWRLRQARQDDAE